MTPIEVIMDAPTDRVITAIDADIILKALDDAGYRIKRNRAERESLIRRITQIRGDNLGDVLRAKNRAELRTIMRGLQTQQQAA